MKYTARSVAARYAITPYMPPFYADATLYFACRRRCCHMPIYACFRLHELRFSRFSCRCFTERSLLPPPSRVTTPSFTFHTTMPPPACHAPYSDDINRKVFDAAASLRASTIMIIAAMMLFHAAIFSPPAMLDDAAI